MSAPLSELSLTGALLSTDLSYTVRDPLGTPVSFAVPYSVIRALFFSTLQASEITDASATGLSVLTGDESTGRAALALGTLAVLDSVDDSNWSGTPLALANGGTGGTTQAAAQAALGVPSLSTSAAFTSAPADTSSITNTDRRVVGASTTSRASVDGAVVLGSAYTWNEKPNSLALGYVASGTVPAIENRTIHLLGRTGDIAAKGSLRFGAEFTGPDPSSGATWDIFSANARLRLFGATVATFTPSGISELGTLLSAKYAAFAHVHSAAALTSGLVAPARLPIATEAEALGGALSTVILTPERARHQFNLFVVPLLSDLATTSPPAAVMSLVVRRFDAASHHTDARYRRVTADPGHELAALDALGQWWEIHEPILTPAMAGARYDYTFATRLIATDDTAAFNRVFAVMRLRQSGVQDTRLSIKFGHYGTGLCLIASSVNATAIQGGGKNVHFGPTIDGDGCVLIGRGSGNVTFDLTQSRTIECTNVCVYGEDEDPPDIGVMCSRNEAEDSSARLTLYRCAAAGWFRFAAHASFGNETQTEMRCIWSNTNDGADPNKVALASTSGRLFAEVITGAVWYPDIMNSAYQPTPTLVGRHLSFNAQARHGCTWVCQGSANSIGLLISRTQGLRITSGYVRSHGIAALVYVGAEDRFNPKQWYIDMHSEGEVPSWFRFERGPGIPDTAIALKIRDCLFQDNATQGVFADGVFNFADANIASVSIDGGSISLGRHGFGAPTALFSDPGKVKLYGKISTPFQLAEPSTLLEFGGQMFLADSETYIEAGRGYTIISSDATESFTFGVHGPLLRDTSALTAGRNRRFLRTGSQQVGSTFELIHAATGGFNLSIIDWDAADQVLVKVLTPGSRIKLVWTGTNWVEY